MNPNREEALFVLELEKSAEKRPAFLDAVCEGDTALRARLEALLAAHEQPETLLATEAESARPAIKLDLTDAPDVMGRHGIGQWCWHIFSRGRVSSHFQNLQSRRVGMASVGGPFQSVNGPVERAGVLNFIGREQANLAGRKPGPGEVPSAAYSYRRRSVPRTRPSAVPTRAPCADSR